MFCGRRLPISSHEPRRLPRAQRDCLTKSWRSAEALLESRLASALLRRNLGRVILAPHAYERRHCGAAIALNAVRWADDVRLHVSSYASSVGAASRGADDRTDFELAKLAVMGVRNSQ